MENIYQLDTIKDEILQALYDHKDDAHPDYYYQYHEIYKFNPRFEGYGSDFSYAMEALHNDGYIKCDKIRTMNYQITNAGIMRIKSQMGFEKERAVKQKEHEAVFTNLKYTKVILWVTVLGVIISIIALIVAIYNR